MLSSLLQGRDNAGAYPAFCTRLEEGSPTIGPRTLDPTPEPSQSPVGNLYSHSMDYDWNGSKSGKGGYHGVEHSMGYDWNGSMPASGKTGKSNGNKSTSAGHSSTKSTTGSTSTSKSGKSTKSSKSSSGTKSSKKSKMLNGGKHPSSTKSHKSKESGVHSNY